MITKLIQPPPRYVPNCVPRIPTPLGMGDLEGSARSLREAIRLQPKNAQLHHNLAATLCQSGDIVASLAVYREGIRLAPGTADIWHDYAAALYESGDIVGAIKAGRHCIKLSPGVSIHHLHLSRFLKDSGDVDGQIKSLRVAIDLDPSAVRPLISFACAEAQRGNKAAAMDWWEKATQVARTNGDPESMAETLSGYGEACTAMQEHHKARLAHEEATQLVPEKAQYHFELAVALHTFARMLPRGLANADNLKWPEFANLKWPEFANVRHALLDQTEDCCKIILDTRNSIQASATQAMRRALHLDPTNANTRAQLVTYLAISGPESRPAAIEICQDGLTLEPEHPDLKNLLHHLLKLGTRKAVKNSAAK